MQKSRTLAPIGTWLGRSFSVLGKTWWTLTALAVTGAFLAALAMGVIYAGAAALAWYFTDAETLARLSSPGALETVAADPTFQAMLMIIHVAALFVGLRIFSRFALACVHATLEPTAGYHGSLARSEKGSFGFMVLMVVQQLCIQVGMALFVIPGLVLAAFLGFAPWVYATRRGGILSSLTGSCKLASGAFFGLLGRMIVLGLVCVGMALVPIAGWIAAPCLAFAAWRELYGDLAPARPAASPTTGPRPTPSGPRAVPTVTRGYGSKPTGGTRPETNRPTTTEA